ncbi:hypothetical protein [Caballeronia sp. Lep1P3]|uniref:hypothetical protein n=1 Tax=Caballeronia sp. Lep1P3 TaxID=2878150 RepID=UPI001FD5A226|nr:hypothetical protein [Caballeronia sp. Lep1P3]
MSPTIPFRRPFQGTRARPSKAQLLPIPRAVAEELALHAHLSLGVLRVGSSDIAPAQQVTEIMLLTKFLADAGHGDFPDEALFEIDQVMAAVFDEGGRSGAWRISAEAFEKLAAVVTLYDHQLKRASLAALTVASERLERVKGGEAYQGAQRKRA